ncbi:MAG: hypothetical protein LBQ22_11245 [Bacteroidales bacterium]|jgi:hypothetical protein|nr:hypothetical protein [Bacteroidales bacterium]
MKNSGINKNQIKEESVKMLQSGLSKQETYDILKEKYSATKPIADVIKYIPNPEIESQYKIHNIILGSILLSLALIFFVSSYNIVVLAIHLSLIYITITKKIKFYIWISIYSAILIIMSIGIQIFYSVEYNILSVATIGLPLFSLLLSMKISRSLCPMPKETKEMYINNNGEKRLKIVYSFQD